MPIARFIMIGLLLAMFGNSACGQTPGQSIGVNPEYAFPTDETPDGIAVSSAALVENATLWNGRIITFTGEAIGERMVRGSMAWIHLNDDAYMATHIGEGAALGGYNSGHAIWLPSELARKIRFFGDYQHQGDLVNVTGVFNAVCQEHGGDMDIHASSLEVVQAGHVVAHPVNLFRLTLGVGLCITAGIFYGARRIALRR